MYGPATDRNHSGGSVGTQHWFGEHAQCVLCDNRRQCTDRYGMRPCQSCQRALLP